MLKAVSKAKNGETLLLLGLSFENLDYLRKEQMNGYVKVVGDEIGLPGLTILIAAGETEDVLADSIKDLIGPNTEVRDNRDGRPAEQPAVKGGPRNV